MRGSSDFLPYNTLNCNGADGTFNETCSGNAGPQFDVSWPQTWSGFFTSHARLKAETRSHSAALRSAEQLFALARWLAPAELATQVPGDADRDADRDRAGLAKGIGDAGESDDDACEGGAACHAAFLDLRAAVGLLPHHDAVAGTMGPGCGNTGEWGETCSSLPMGAPGQRGAVADEYARRLSEGLERLRPLIDGAATALLRAGARQAAAPSDSSSDGSSDSSSDSDVPSSEPANRTATAEGAAAAGSGNDAVSSDAAEFLSRLRAGRAARLVLYNPLGWTLRRWVAVPVPAGLDGAHVRDAHTQRTVPSDLLPAGALLCTDDACSALPPTANSAPGCASPPGSRLRPSATRVALPCMLPCSRRCPLSLGPSARTPTRGAHAPTPAALHAWCAASTGAARSSSSASTCRRSASRPTRSTPPPRPAPRAATATRPRTSAWRWWRMTRRSSCPTRSSPCDSTKPLAASRRLSTAAPARRARSTGRP